MELSPDRAIPQLNTGRQQKRSKRRYDEMVVVDDGASSHFDGRFPFSFFVHRLVDSMRGMSEGSGEAALAHQVRALHAKKHQIHDGHDFISLTMIDRMIV
jgi:hypothetical protein